MKFSYAALASILASVVYSQTIAGEVAQLPSCALSCLTSAISGAGCGLSDYACQCGTAKNGITTAATPCVLQKCPTSDALKTQSITSEICNIQDAAGGSGSGSSSSSVSTPAGTTPGTTYAATSPVGSSLPTGGSFITTPTPVGTAKASSTAAGAGTSSSSSTSSSVPQVSGSPGNRLQAGGVLAGAVALIALVV